MTKKKKKEIYTSKAGFFLPTFISAKYTQSETVKVDDYTLTRLDKSVGRVIEMLIIDLNKEITGIFLTKDNRQQLIPEEGKGWTIGFLYKEKEN